MKLFDRKKQNRQRSLVLCFGIALVAASGCTSMISAPSFVKDLPWMEDDEPEYITPTSIVGNWDPEQLYQQGKPTVRGFGGRFFFKNKDHEGHIKVDGTVTVYVFDDENPQVNNQKPLLKYVITAEQLPRHYSKNKQNEHTYSFWLPWDEVGGPQRLLSLVVRFDGKQGEVVMSNGTREILPGTQNKITAKMDQYTSPYDKLNETQPSSFPDAFSPVQHAGYRNSSISRLDRDVMPINQESQNGNSNSKIKIDTTTIDVPPSWGRGGQFGTGPEMDSSIIDIDPNSDRSTTLENTQTNSINNDQQLLNEFQEWRRQRQQQPVNTRISNNASAEDVANSRNMFQANDTRGFHQQTKYGAFANQKDWETKAPAYSAAAARRDRFSRSRFRARDSRIGRPRLGPGRSTPTPIGWPSDPPQSQQSNLKNAANLNSTNEPPSYDSWQRLPEKRVNR